MRHWIAPTTVCNPSHFLLISFSFLLVPWPLLEPDCLKQKAKHLGTHHIKGISQRVQSRKESTSTYIITPDSDSNVGL